MPRSNFYYYYANNNCFCTVLVGKSLKKVTMFYKAVQTQEADSGVFTLFCQHGKSQEGQIENSSAKDN